MNEKFKLLVAVFVLYALSIGTTFLPATAGNIFGKAGLTFLLAAVAGILVTVLMWSYLNNPKGKKSSKGFIIFLTILVSIVMVFVVPIYLSGAKISRYCNTPGADCS